VSGTATEMDSTAAMKPPADPWAAVISWLKDSAAGESHAESGPNWPLRRIRHEGGGAARHRAAAERARTASTRARSAIVTFVERFSAKSISITWRDSTAANYCEQLWVRRIARSQGVCALTGTTIARGDAVYGPASRAADRPTNCAQMVLARVLEDLE